MARHRETSPDIEMALPIVPMLDLSFQLLFFFVATFNPGKAEGKLQMNLPASGQAKAQDQSQVDPSKISEPNLEIPSDFVVVVSAREDSFTLSIRDSEKVNEVGVLRNLTKENRKEEVAKLLDILRERLAEKLKGRQAKDGDKAGDNVKIEATKKTKHADLVAVMDACIRAGYTQVGFAPPPDFQ
jgi:biopolymer transport protein ExbD